jgi:ABC-type sugar transport system substrate-binding protein
MNTPVVVERTGNQYRAIGGLPGMKTALGRTPEEAVDKLRAVWKKRLSKGAQIVGLDLDEKGAALMDSTEDPAREDAAEVLFLIPTNLTRPFFTQLLQECERAISTELNLRPILRYVPQDEQEYDEQVVAGLLQKEYGWSQRFKVVVVCPTGSPGLTRAIAKAIYDARRGVSLIGLTLPFTDAAIFAEYGMVTPPHVMCDNFAGGRKLGENVAIHLPEERSRPNILLISGPQNRVDSADRIAGFKAGLLNRNIHAEFLHPWEGLICNWRRSDAREGFAQWMRNSRTRVDVVMAANDDMALGIHDAIGDLRGTPHHRNIANCLIYGFDAIPEMRHRIESGDHHLKGTIEQPMRQIASNLVSHINYLHFKKRDAIPVSLAEPRFHGAESTSQQAPPGYTKTSPHWKTHKEAAEIWQCKPDTVSRYPKQARTEHDESGEWGYLTIHGQTHKFRVVQNGGAPKVCWWIPDGS